MAPQKYVYTLKPIDVTFYNKDFTDEIKLRILKWGVYPRLSKCTLYNDMCLVKQNQREV